MRRSSPALALLATAIAAAVVVGCTSNSPNPGPSATDGQSTTPGTSGSSTSPSTRSTATPPPTTTTPADPRVAAALKAYESFVTAYQVSQQHPPAAPNKPYVPGGNFPKYSFDPARAETVSSILFLTEGNLKYEGTAPTHRASVTNTNLGAAPYPTVTVTDCPTAPASWKVVATTGPPPTTKTPKVPPPYKVTAQVIFYEQHWGVSTLKVDDSKTCSP